MKALTAGVIATSILIPSVGPAHAARDGRDWDQRFVGAHEAQAAGDVNGDGLEDLLMNDGDVAWVVFGARKDRDVNVEHLGGRGFMIGYSLKGYFWTSPLGDVNGDGLDDVGFADPEARVPERGRPGIVYVIFGKKDSDPVDVREFDGTDPRGYRILGAYDFTLTGYQGLEPAGDVNQDGLDDVIVAAPFGSATYVVFGQASSSDQDLLEFEDDLDPAMCNVAVQDGCGPGYRIRTNSPDSSSSYSISNAGDVNGDTIPDAFITVWPSAGAGSIFVVFGKADRLPVDVREEGTWGYRIRRGSGPGGVGAPSSVGDVNRDGKDDMALACCLSRRASRRMSRKFIIFGRAQVGTIELSDIRDEGFSITNKRRRDAGVGATITFDANGDRYPDIAIGSPYASRDQDYEGSVYVIHGRKRLRDVNLQDLGSRGYRIDGNQRELFFGYSLDGVGDMDGDGRDELLISTQGYDGSKKAFLYASGS